MMSYLVLPKNNEYRKNKTNSAAGELPPKFLFSAFFAWA
jgi:hypothetical protein